jgi:hypothetical protein
VAKAESEGDLSGGNVCHYHSGFSVAIVDINATLVAGNLRFDKLDAKLDALSNGLRGRPSWAVATVISFLCALSVFLASVAYGQWHEAQAVKTAIQQIRTGGSLP